MKICVPLCDYGVSGRHLSKCLDEHSYEAYLQGRKDAEDAMFKIVVALIRSSDGEVRIPHSIIVDDLGWVLTRFDDMVDNSIVFRVHRGSVAL
jgi:hypothetical protein